MKAFLSDVTSGAYTLRDHYETPMRGEHAFTAVELFGHLRRYVADTGLYSTIDSVMSLGHCLAKKYYAIAPKVEGSSR